MYIVSRDKETIINTEQIASIYLEDCSIFVNNAGSEHFMFACYENRREAKNDFISIMVNIGGKSKYLELGEEND